MNTVPQIIYNTTSN